MSDRYRIDGVLGSGGASTVFKAFDRQEGHDVALKRVVAANLPSPQAARRVEALLEREYYVLTQLAHPKIIRVYDYGVDEDGPYYTMEWLRGQTLRQSGRLPVRAVCSIIRDVASCLSMLHSRRLVHRDVTTNNIHLSDEGGAKLIDFGGMVPVGVPKFLVGTPPFMAPESDGIQRVDGKTDLFALGACFYYALTGRHAYPARSTAELSEAWRTGPLWPSQLVPDVPEALERLVLQMLSLTPAGRPSSAAEVFERLTSIAGLPEEEAPAVARAYIESPALTARDDALRTIREVAARAAAGRGASLLITSASGVGRSRLLESAMLEAKFAGLTVLRTDALSSGRGGLAAMQSLARDLRDDVAGAPGAPPSRPRSTSEAVEAIKAVSSRRPIAVAVDDLHLVDPESVASLALLSTFAEDLSLLLIMTLGEGSSQAMDGALSIVLRSATRIELSPFTEPETRLVLSSLFGDVPNIDVLSTMAHESTGGNARELLHAAQALVDGSSVRYVGGAWIVDGDPRSIRGALIRCGHNDLPVHQLSTDARVLLAAVALDRDSILSLFDYREVFFDGDRSRANAAVTALHQAGLVALIEDTLRLAREAHREHVVSSLSQDERRGIHAKLAHCTQRLANPIYPAYHYALAGRFADAARGFVGYRDFADQHPQDPVLTRSIVGDAVGMLVENSSSFSRAFVTDCVAIYVLNCAHRGLPERVVPHLAHCLRELSWLTALEDYHARVDLEPSARLPMVLGLSQSRCADATGMNPVLALRRLCQASIIAAICARHMADPALLAHVPDLSPFVSLSPAIGIVCKHIDAVATIARGQFWEGRRMTLDVVGELRGPVGERLDPVTRMAIERAALGQLCAVEADNAVQGALAHFDELAVHFPNAAESCRARYFLSCGRVKECDEARVACERLALQLGGLQETRVAEMASYLFLYALSDDVLGLKRVLAGVTEVSKTRPAWRFRVALAGAHLARCRGDFASSLATVEASLAEIEWDHPDREPLLALHVALKHLRGESADAVGLGTRYIDELSLRRKPIAAVALWTALAKLQTADFEAAECLAQLAQRALEGEAAGGIALGFCFEVRARIGSRRGDREAFAEWVARCAALYRHGENSTLTARYEALLRADEQGQAEATRAERRAALAADPTLAATTLNESPSSGEMLSEMLDLTTNHVDEIDVAPRAHPLDRVS